MRRACCDWAAVRLGRPSDALTRAETCPRHLRGVTVHNRPAVEPNRRRLRRSVRRFVMREQWTGMLRRAGELVP